MTELSFKRHIMWLEPGRVLGDAITGATVRPDSGLAGTQMSCADRAREFYFLRQPTGGWVNWELTLRCPQSCLHCFQECVRSEAMVSMPRAKWVPVVAALERWSPQEVSLTGGDPALLEGLPEIILYLRGALPQARLRLLTTGPGLLLREDLADLLRLCAQSRVTLHLTLLGPTSDRHDVLTAREGSFCELEKAIELARAESVEVELRLHLFNGSLSDWASAAEGAEDLVPGRWYASTLLYPPRRAQGKRNWKRLLPSVATMRQAFADALFAPLASEYVSFEPVCAAGCQVITIDPKGRVRGCDVAGVVPDAPHIESVRDSRTAARGWRESQSRPDRCDACQWRLWCRYCPTACRALGEYYCCLVDLAARHVRRRLGEYRRAGATPVHSPASSLSGLDICGPQRVHERGA